MQLLQDILGTIDRTETEEDDATIQQVWSMTGSEAILVSTIKPDTNEEQAIFGEGFENGLVVVCRPLMAQGLLERHDPHA